MAPYLYLSLTVGLHVTNRDTLSLSSNFQLSFSHFLTYHFKVASFFIHGHNPHPQTHHFHVFFFTFHSLYTFTFISIQNSLFHHHSFKNSQRPNPTTNTVQMLLLPSVSGIWDTLTRVANNARESILAIRRGMLIFRQICNYSCTFTINV